MKKLSGKAICFLMILILLFPYEVSANPLPEWDINAFLREKGMPQEVIEQLPEKQKELIAATLEEDAVFESYESREYYSEAAENNGIQPMMEIIPTSELTLSVVSFSQSISGVSCYGIYPSFVWHKAVKVKNDSFAMALFPGWEVIPQECNLELWMANTQGDLVQHVSIAPKEPSSYGYSYTVPSSIGGLQGIYEGHAYLAARRTVSSAAPAISLQYIDDVSSLFNVSYTIKLGPATITVNGNEDNLRYRSGNYYF